MLRGLGRSPFGPRAPFGGGATPNPAESTSAAVESPLPADSRSALTPTAAGTTVRTGQGRRPGRRAVRDAQAAYPHAARRPARHEPGRRDGPEDPAQRDPRASSSTSATPRTRCSTATSASAWSTRSSTRPSASARSSCLLKDDKIGDIMINGPKKIFIEKEGRIQKSEVVFRDNEHLLQIIDRIVSRVGRRVDETSPMVDARLPNGSRFNAIIPPLALDGPVVTIRMFGSQAALEGRPAPVQGVHARDARAHGRGDEGAAEHHHLGRHRLGQDDAAQHALELHPARSSRDHDRGRGRASAPAGPRRAAGDAPGQHRGPGRRHGHRPGEERPANAARPDHHRRVPGGRDPRHDPGHEHRPRGLDDHGPRQHAARRLEPARDHDQHGRPRAAHPRPACRSSPRPST